MNKERLEHAITVIEGLKAGGVQPVEVDETDGDRISMSDWGKRHTCGTVGCLGGWFTLDPSFRAEGLRNENDINPESAVEDLRPWFNGVRDYDALQEFFDLNIYEIRHIFGGYNTNSLDDGIDRIRWVLLGADVEELYMQRQKQRGNEL
jgi:hypothetical protein